GVDYGRVSVIHGDTGAIPAGMGAFGSRATTIGGSAVLRSAERLRERILELASEHLEIAAADLTVSGDRVVARGAESRSATLAELHGELSEEAYFESEDMTFPYGVHCAAV